MVHQVTEISVRKPVPWQFQHAVVHRRKGWRLDYRAGGLYGIRAAGFRFGLFQIHAGSHGYGSGSGVQPHQRLGKLAVIAVYQVKVSTANTSP